MRRIRLTLIIAACLLVSSCAIDQSYKIRTWEQSWIDAEKAIKKHQYKSAIPCAKRAVAIAEGFGGNNYRLGISFRTLGDAESGVSKIKQAEAAYKRAIAVFETWVSDNTSPSVEFTLNKEELALAKCRLASLYASEKRFDDSLNYFQEAAKLYESLVGSDYKALSDIIVAHQAVICLAEMAKTFAAAQKMELAHETYTKALRLASAASIPEYLLRDLRDEQLKLLQEEGWQAESQKLLADALFARSTADGYLALSEKDFGSAEISFRKAYQQANESVFSERRQLRALYNLSSLFAQEGKFPELDQCARNAEQFVRKNGVEYDKDYELILLNAANYCLLNNKIVLAVEYANKLLDYRRRQYGPDSIEACEALALKGMAELKTGQVKLALTEASTAATILERTYKTNRRATVAMSKTADLFTALGRFNEAEQLLRQIINIKLMAKDPSDPLITSLRVNLFVLYHRSHQEQKAAETIKEISKTLEDANTNERIAAFAPLVLTVRFCTAIGWYKAAEPAVKLGQSILSHDLHGLFPDATAQKNWETDVSIIQQKLGRPI